MWIIMDERDADNLLRYLYKGRRPVHVHTLLCGCGETADLRQSPSAWNGWRILPHPTCPACLAKEQDSEWRLMPTRARMRFLRLVESLAHPAR